MSTAPLDLLREPRLEQGLPDPAALAAQRRRLVLRGSLIGGALLALALAVTALLMLRQQQLQAELERLAGVEAEVQAAETRLTAARGKLKTLTTANRALVNGLVTARSGSALMRDLQTRVPQGVQLTAAEVPSGGQRLRLVGAAADPQAFARINALQIELARSPLLTPASVSLLKAARSDARTAIPGVPKGPAGLVTFEITAQFRPSLPPAAELQILRALGARGMAERLQLLAAEGLLR
jgi:type IV pilus assembly protein PilN